MKRNCTCYLKTTVVRVKPVKRANRNRRVTANLYDILSFSFADDSVSPAIPSRDNSVSDHGHSWCGGWGYEFECGSYALTLDAYKKVAESLSNSNLSTMKDLFSFLSSLIHESNESLTFKATLNNFKPFANIMCAWTRDDIECVQKAMIKVLAAVSGKTNWVTRHALKGFMCNTTSHNFLITAFNTWEGSWQLVAWWFRRDAILTPSVLNSALVPCRVSEHLKQDPAVPLELIVLPSNGTIADLKTKLSVHGSDPIKEIRSQKRHTDGEGGGFQTQRKRQC
ncbi:hypothetical protein SADUNF_Sadunf13G0069700 [Salix dunnii]|uniref:Uncharacterized protein n=1 Tax=Salix dunnii TaxID=1413687 RepID=A0A835MLW0_9ROSI|nr:hypothetical protein SADUNF_Sadunf13G0069700 [Salix dunnii]